MGLLRSIFPTIWFPPFRRGDWADAQVIERERFGTYDPLSIPGDVKYETVDYDRGQRIEIEFSGGVIYVREMPLPHYLRSGYHHEPRVFGELFLEGLRTFFR
jgi:hypothetical protein